MTAKLDYRWHLRQVMARQEMFSTTDLSGRLLTRGIRLSPSQVYRLVVERPERLSLKILMALLDILGCSMEELIEPVAAASPGQESQSSQWRWRDRRPAAEKGSHNSRREIGGSLFARGAPRPPRRNSRPRLRRAAPALDSCAVEEVVARVAPGRSTRTSSGPGVAGPAVEYSPTGVRRLRVSSATCSSPCRDAGVQGISPPRCASCDKQLRSFYRRGEDWYCAVCGPEPLACAACGKLRKVAARDRAGQPSLPLLPAG